MAMPLFGYECPNAIEDQQEFSQELARTDVVEFILEGAFFNKRQALISQLKNHNTPVFAHSIEMSIGSAEAFKAKHFAQIRTVLDQVNCLAYSDHLCMTEAGGIAIGQLTTLPFTEECVDVVCRKIDIICNNLNVPFMLENITNRFYYPGNEFDEPSFIHKILAKTDCQLLLDVTNLYINSVNFNFDPYQWLAKIDPQKILAIHLAGGEWEEGKLYDTHSQPVHQEVWQLYQWVLQISKPQYVIVEWDQGIPPIATVQKEVAQARYYFADGMQKSHVNEVCYAAA